MPTDIRPRRRPGQDWGGVICAALAVAPLLIAAPTGRHSVDPENYAGLASPDGAEATRWAAACPARRNAMALATLGPELCAATPTERVTLAATLPH